MRQITPNDVKVRLKILSFNESDLNKRSYNFDSINKMRVEDAKRLLDHNRSGLDTVTCINLFESIALNGKSFSDIDKYARILTEELVSRPRNAKETLTLIRRRVGKIKNKAKSDSGEKAQDAVFDAMPKTPSFSVTESKMCEVYENIIDRMNILQECDRVIENYMTISKRFNIDMIIYENYKKNGTYDTVLEICKKIETYDIPDDIKINTVLETTWYGFNTNDIVLDEEVLYEAVTDYFSYMSGLNTSDIKDIIENAMFTNDKETPKNIKMVMEEDPEKDSTDDASNIDNAIMEYYINNNPPFAVLNENYDFKEIFNKFKEEEASKEDFKPESKMRSLITKLYANNVENIIEGTPNLLRWFRSFLILGTGAFFGPIGPIVMIIGFIADKFISMGCDRKETERMLRCFNNELKQAKEKMETVEDKDEKERLKKYIDALKKAIDEIDSYNNDLLTDKEMEEKYENMDFDFSDEFDDSDLFNDDDDDVDLSKFLDEAFIKLSDSVEQFIESGRFVTRTDMYNLPSIMNENDLITTAKIISMYPDEFYKDEFNSGIEDEIAKLESSDFSFPSINRSIRKSNLRSAQLNLNGEEKKIHTLPEACDAINDICEISESLRIIIDNGTGCNSSAILESSISNKLKMASMKLRSFMTKMSDKEKQISKSVDLGMNNLSKSAERALTNDNRESIIKGSILPSASKVLKLAIVNAGLVAIGHPVLAIIGTLGYLGTSAKFKHKERQMIIDEIEIELKMCQKYKDIAESKNDMKALKQLLMIERDLQRQLQRIKYKMKVDLGKKYYDTKNVEQN